MHEPRPFGLLVEGDAPTERDTTFIHSLARQLTNLKDLGELDSLKITRDLPDGGSVIVQDMGGIFKVIVSKSSQSKEQPFYGYAQPYIPMLFSGTFLRCWFREDEGTLPLKITEQCRKRLSAYKELKVAKELDLARFVIEYADKFKQLEPTLTGPAFRHTQFMSIKPTMYSGAMGELMQVVSGYGRLFDESFKDTEKEDIENAVMVLPPDVFDDALKEINSQVLPGYTGTPNADGQIQMDYRPGENNLVAFDTAKAPWLIRVSSLGVFAMPLPVVPMTTTKAFRDYITQVDDQEVLKILDRFGGMPTGEGFPEGNDFQTWQRAGVIIKVCDSSDFYQYTPMFVDCGWSINSSGTEAFNTCWTYRNDGLIEAYAYKLKLSLASIDKGGWLGPQKTDLSEIGAYVSALYSLLPAGDTKTHAIIYKIRRSADELLKRAQAKRGLKIDQNEVDYWDNLVLPPLAAHGGGMVRVSAGPVYWPNPITSLGGLKFPVSGGKGCQSFNMISPDYKGGVVRCDTVVFGAYINDQLRYIKYFYDERTAKESVESTYEDVMIVGQWEKTETTTSSSLQGHFYTTDYDDRQLISPNVVFTSIRGLDMGYGNPLFVTPSVLYKWGTLSRSRYYKHEKTVLTKRGGSMGNAVCVPKFNRDAILYVFDESTTSHTREEVHSLHSMADPTSYGIWTYDPAFHWIGSDGKGLPRPKTGDYVYVSGPPEYNPTTSSDFADSGDWYGVGNGYIDISHICAKYTDSRVVANHSASGVSIGGEGPTIPKHEVTIHEPGKQSGYVTLTTGTIDAVKVHNNIPAAGYYEYFPVLVGNELIYFHRDVCRVLFGECEYMNISDENATKERRHRWGFSNLVDHTAHHYFFGVINE